MPRKQELLFGTQASASDIEEIKAEFHPSNIVNVEFALPVGAIITMSGNLAPTGYLPCDGTIYNIEDYPNLANYYENAQGSKNFYGGDGVTTFAVPDFRGEFLRGAGANGHENQGSGANVGVHQDSSYLLYDWANNQYAGIYYPKSPSSGYQSTRGNIDSRYVIGKRLSVQAANPLTTPSSTTNDIYADNFRPTNTSVLYCVKY